MIVLKWLKPDAALLIIILYHVSPSLAEDYPSLNSPPTIISSRDWTIPSNTSINTLVKKIEATDGDNDTLEYGIEHSTGFNIVLSNPEPLPFTVDPKHGYVYTNQSLLHLAGQKIYMYVTVSDGHQVSKVQVQIKIEDVSSSNSLSNFPAKDVIPPVSYPIDRSKVVLIPPSGSKQKPTKLKDVSKSNNESFAINPVGSIFTRVPFTTGTSESSSGIDENENINKRKDLSNTIHSGNSTNSETEKTNDSSYDSFKKIFIMILPISVLIVSLFVAGILTFLFRKRICSERKTKIKDDLKKKSTTSSLGDSIVLQHWIPRIHNGRYECVDGHSQGSVTSFVDGNTKTADKWEFPRHHIKVFNILGEGCFAQVWKCEALNIDNKEGYSVVAVKMLRENPAEKDKLDLLQELQLMKMLDPHPNVVRLLGCCTEKDPVFVIMEYVARGKLQSYLRMSRTQRYYNNMYGSSDCLTSHNLTSFCYQIAKGMQYLSSKGIIHRDLAARNILVTEDHTCKIADFGFARDVMTSHIYERKSEGRLPIRWMAPESLYDNIYSVKSDIWSYGILVWEIVTLGSTPYPGISAADVMRNVRDGYRLEKPEHCRRELYNIMYYCWDNDPQERPNFTELVDLLEQLLLTETDYIQLDRFPDHSYYNMVPLNGEKL